MYVHWEGIASLKLSNNMQGTNNKAGNRGHLDRFWDCGTSEQILGRSVSGTEAQNRAASFHWRKHILCDYAAHTRDKHHTIQHV